MGMRGELDAIASGSQTRSPVEIASPDASLARYFSALQFQSSACQSFSLAVRESVESGVTANASAARLSMGMSGDYETATTLGATHVRVGTALFGAR